MSTTPLSDGEIREFGFEVVTHGSRRDLCGFYTKSWRPLSSEVVERLSARQLWRDGYLDARVMVFCLPLWAAFPGARNTLIEFVGRDPLAVGGRCVLFYEYRLRLRAQRIIQLDQYLASINIQVLNQRVDRVILVSYVLRSDYYVEGGRIVD